MKHPNNEKYWKLSSFENTYLEDSFVLDIIESKSQICFLMEVVLTEDHELYTTPNNGEQYCYKNGKVSFLEINFIKWLSRKMIPFTDIDDKKDFGNIDSFIVTPQGYHLSGDWGEVIINSKQVELLW